MNDEKKFTQIVFSNFIIDREMYFNQSQGCEFSVQEDAEFISFSVYEAASIIRVYIESMKKTVSEVQSSRKFMVKK